MHSSFSLSTLIKHYDSCLSICLSGHIFVSQQKSQHHEILAPGVIWAKLNVPFSLFTIKEIINEEKLNWIECLFLKNLKT